MFRLTLPLTIMLTLAAGTAAASETRITKHFFEYNTIKYFRGKAENVQLGSYGVKKDPIGADAYLLIQNKIKTAYLTGHVKQIAPVTIDWAKQSKLDLEASFFAFFSPGSKLAVEGSYEKAKSAKLKLVKFWIDMGPLETILNTEASGARNYLAEEGNDGRVVGEIWVAMEGSLAEHFEASAGIIFQEGESGIEVVAKGGALGAQTITLGANSTFAYMLFKVKEWNKEKTKVLVLEDDKKGLG